MTRLQESVHSSVHEVKVLKELTANQSSQRISSRSKRIDRGVSCLHKPRHSRKCRPPEPRKDHTGRRRPACPHTRTYRYTYCIVQIAKKRCARVRTSSARFIIANVASDALSSTASPQAASWPLAKPKPLLLNNNNNNSAEEE